MTVGKAEKAAWEKPVLKTHRIQVVTKAALGSNCDAIVLNGNHIDLGLC